MNDPPCDPSLKAALQSVPNGRWAVGVSGGADSIALFHLIRTLRPDLHHVVVAHLNHQTRERESDADEAFVCALAPDARIARRNEIEPTLSSLPANRSARYRAMRFAHFANIVARDRLNGVLLAHHADDQAETVFQRLLRGAGYRSLAGIKPIATVNGVRVVRLLLGVRRETLRSFLRDANLPWREDASNDSPAYLRNRLRAILREREDLTAALFELSRTSADLRRFVRRTAPKLDQSFGMRELDDLPAILARESAGRWLRECGVAPQLIDRATIDRLRHMCADAASANRQQFPGAIFVRRRGGIISAE